jgi:hypothetical protein
MPKFEFVVVRSLQPKVTNVVPPSVEFGDSIGAMTLLDDRLFVVRQVPSLRFVTVYDVQTMNVERKIFVPGLGYSSFGLAVSATSRASYLFVSDFHQSRVHRIDLGAQYSTAMTSADAGGRREQPADNAAGVTVSWPVASHPVGLAITRSGHLLVTCCWANVLQLYDPDDGRLVRETPFCLRDRHNPEYATELPPVAVNDEELYAVSHKGPVHGVCIIRAVDGTAVACYGRSAGRVGPAGPTLCHPRGLAVVPRSHCILVADKENNRIVVIDATLRQAKVLPLSLGGEWDNDLLQPQALCLDEKRNRLYVGELEGKSRLIVVSGINNVYFYD